MNLKKFIKNIDSLFLKGIKKKGTYKLNYLILPEYAIKYCVAPTLEEPNMILSINNNKQRRKVFKQIKKQVKTKVATEREPVLMP